jgi:hypothetical protein
MTVAYRPQPLWLAMGPLLGAFSGAVVATLLIWGLALVGSTSLTWGGIGAGVVLGLYLGIVYGGACGLAVGFVVGVPMVFLVGRHLPREVARRRAHVWGAVLPPATMIVLAAVVLDARLSWSQGEDSATFLVLAGAALLGSRSAGWLAGLDGLPKPVS